MRVLLIQVASFLYHEERMNVMVEPDVHDRFARFPGFGFVQTFYNQDLGYVPGQGRLTSVSR